MFPRARQFTFPIRLGFCLATALLLRASAVGAETVDFQQGVRPILAEHCFSCHGPEKQEGGLRLDRRRDALRGGDSYAPAIVPGSSDKSPLFQFVSRTDADLQMPPEKSPLSTREIDLLRKWIDSGADWPVDGSDGEDPALSHWAYQPLRRPEVPTAPPSDWLPIRNPIDRFVAAKLAANGLRPSPPADRATLLRRVHFALLGLPPPPEQVAEFIADSSATAYERLVDRLLASPQLGERWARHWLDVVRFAESHGFEMNQARPNAWRFRDYVIAAFNDDKPYDQFVREQLAGDAWGAEEATGFLVGGPWDQVKSPDPVLTAQQRADELHDMVNTTGTTFLALTIGCSRCHSHKFDPIPQTDYYAIKACLEGVQHGERELPRERRTLRPDERVREIESWRAELAELESRAARGPVNARVNVEDFAPTLATKVRFTIEATNQAQPCLDELEVWTDDPTPRNVAAAAAGAKATASSVYPGSQLHRLEHVNDGRYGNSRSWISNEPGKGWVEIEFAKPARIHRILWGRDREEKYTDRLAIEYRVEIHDSQQWRTVASSRGRPASDDALVARRKELEQQIASVHQADRIYAGNFVQPSATLRFHRGDPTQPREAVRPASLARIGKRFELPGEAPEQERRRQLAEWIADPANPLTARVMVNRIWQQYFGEGIVSTPSDFGVNGARPTHPELLDWLAVELIEHRWSLKHIHRLIATSATYQQASAAVAEGMRIDAGCRLLWRYPPRRLEAEALRDSILAVCGNLRVEMGGPGFDLFEPNDNYVKVYKPKQMFGPDEWRRMVYQAKPRMQLDDIFGSFDCPDAGQIAPKRNRSTTALQALNLLNSPFMIQQAHLFAQRLQQEAGDDAAAQVRRAFELAFQRQPSAEEANLSGRLIHDAGLDTFCRALLNANEFLYVY